MKTYQLLGVSSLLTAAFLMSGCDVEQKAVSSQAQGPSPSQIQIAKEEILKEMAARNQSRQNGFNKIRTQSLDGEGRIFFNQIANELVIYKDKPVLQLKDLKEVEISDLTAKLRIEQALRKDSFTGRDIAQIPDQELRAMLSDTFSDEAVSYNERDRTIVKLDSGRACERNPLSDKQPDCFFIQGLDSKTSLAQSIQLAYRKLDLKSAP